MILNHTKRRRILQALLPLLAFVWAMLPAMPCCHELGAVGTQDSSSIVMAGHAGHHHGTAGATHGFTVDHGTSHCQDGSVSNTDPPCTDVEKTSNDFRPVDVVPALMVATSILPVLEVLPANDAAPLPSDPSPPPRHRPLHLEKSVLLI